MSPDAMGVPSTTKRGIALAFLFAGILAWDTKRALMKLEVAPESTIAIVATGAGKDGWESWMGSWRCGRGVADEMVERCMGSGDLGALWLREVFSLSEPGLFPAAH